MAVAFAIMIAINAALGVANYKQGSYKAAMFSCFSTGFICFALIVQIAAV